MMLRYSASHFATFLQDVDSVASIVHRDIQNLQSLHFWRMNDISTFLIDISGRGVTQIAIATLSIRVPCHFFFFVTIYYTERQHLYLNYQGRVSEMDNLIKMILLAYQLRILCILS